MYMYIRVCRPFGSCKKTTCFLSQAKIPPTWYVCNIEISLSTWLLSIRELFFSPLTVFFPHSTRFFSPSSETHRLLFLLRQPSCLAFLEINRLQSHELASSFLSFLFFFSPYLLLPCFLLSLFCLRSLWAFLLLHSTRTSTSTAFINKPPEK